mmetsp:Transcript_63912/g.147169  ORF Transcript_63912/g.147169 Transcript_63912/m.147169 type:complete len:128 (+) Transcript_63912:32-415(+)
MGGQESVLPDCNSVAVACYRDISPNTEEEEARRQVRLATEACCAVHKPSRVWDLTAHGLQGTTPSPSWCPLRGVCETGWWCLQHDAPRSMLSHQQPRGCGGLRALTLCLTQKTALTVSWKRQRRNII